MAREQELRARIARLADLPADERASAVEAIAREERVDPTELLAMLREYEDAGQYFASLRAEFPVSSIFEAMEGAGQQDPLRLLGTQVGHYRVEEYLGGGGMACVYRARDLNMRRDAALKFLPPELGRSDTSVHRFRHEADAASSLDHTNIATIYESGQTATGQIYIAMAFYDGETLRAKISRGPMPVDVGIRYALGMARALEEAHSHGIVHRDVKPANVIVTRTGVVKLLDFGVAKMADLTSVTDTGMKVGTAAYMAPEQARGEPATESADVWALGVTLYEMLSSRHPFAGSYALATAYRICNERQEDLRALRPDVPEALAGLVAECLEKDPSRRPPTMHEVVGRLAALAMGPEPGPAGLLPRRLAVVTAVAALAVVALVVLMLFRPWERTVVVMESERRVAILPVEPEAAGAATVPSSLVRSVEFMLSDVGASVERGAEGLFVVLPEELYSNDVASAAGALSSFSAGEALVSRVRAADRGYVLDLRLVDAASGRELDDGRVDLEGDVGADERDRSLRVIADLLDVRIPDETAAQQRIGGTTVPSAYEYFTTGRGYLQRFEEPGNVAMALGSLDQAIRADGDFAMAYAARGEAYYREYRSTTDTTFLALAQADGEEAVRLAPDLAAAHVILGTAYLARGLTRDADLEFRTAADLDDRSADAFAGLADVYDRQDRYDLALENIRKAIARRPGYWLYYNRLGQLELEAGHYPEAIGAFREVITRYPAGAWGYNNLGAAYWHADSLEQAMLQYRKATVVNPQARDAIAMALSNIAGMHYEARDFSAAIEAYRQSLEVDSTDIDGWNQLGNAYWRIDEPGMANVAWQEVIGRAEGYLEVNPSDVGAWEYLSEAHAKRGERDEAVAAARRVEALLGQSVSAPLTLTIVFELLGERERALEFAAKALDTRWSFNHIDASIWLDSLKTDPRYARMRAAAEESLSIGGA